MKKWMRWPAFLGLVGLAAVCLPEQSRAEAEFRALWVDAFHPGLKTASQVDQLIAEARAGHFNALVVQVRKRGDAYYASRFEPKATDVAPGYDPLADLLVKAHDTRKGQRLEVHAWIVAYHIWNRQNDVPVQSTHPYNLHPDWLTENYQGEQWDGGNYGFDPAHPEVQQHTHNVVMDIVERYDVDGLHFDYIRYPGTDWGYNPVAVARFNERLGRSGRPVPGDLQWQQFRRDEVTALVRKVYLSAAAVKPSVKISAATITWAPGITSADQWTSTAAYRRVLQDWRGWMEEGILDLNIPMTYFRESSHPLDYDRWIDFIKNHQYGRQAVIGTGLYLNSISENIDQIRDARAPSSLGRRAAGVTGFSYARHSSAGESRTVFLNALVRPSVHDQGSEPVFAELAEIPGMPWKSRPVRGHVKGRVVRETGSGLVAVENALLELGGATGRELRSDATGFWGAVDLAPGVYAVTGHGADGRTARATFEVKAGGVVEVDLVLAPTAAERLFFGVAAAGGVAAAAIRWETTEAVKSWIRYGRRGMPGTQVESPAGEGQRHGVLLTGLLTGVDYWYELGAIVDGEEIVSAGYDLKLGGEDIIVDNRAATLSGVWGSSTAGVEKYGEDYRYTGTVSGEARSVAEYVPVLVQSGRYNVYVWYPAGSNRSIQAPITIGHTQGEVVVRVDQTKRGGEWVLVGNGLPLAPGTPGFVRLSHDTGESGKLVVADAVRWALASDAEDVPAAGKLPAWWADHFGLAEDAAGEDLDGDGYDHRAEYLFGTDPLQASSRPRLELETEAGGGMNLVVGPVLAARVYELEEGWQGEQGVEWAKFAGWEGETAQEKRIAVDPMEGTYRFFRLKVSFPEQR